MILGVLRNFFERRPTKQNLVAAGVFQPDIFGSTLDKIEEKEKQEIPNFVIKCIQRIESDEKFLKELGIYRVSGSIAQVQKIRFAVSLLYNGGIQKPRGQLRGRGSKINTKNQSRAWFMDGPIVSCGTYPTTPVPHS